MGQHTAATSDENEHATTNSRKRHLTETRENPHFTARNNTSSPQIHGYGTIMKWDEEKLGDRCQEIVASEHAHPEAIGVVDESGVAKSGKQTVGVGRQWLGSKGKVDNGVVGVHLSYAAPGFQCLLDSRLYLPESWANDADRRKKTTYPRMCSFTQNRKSLWN